MLDADLAALEAHAIIAPSSLLASSSKKNKNHENNNHDTLGVVVESGSDDGDITGITSEACVESSSRQTRSLRSSSAPSDLERHSSKITTNTNEVHDALLTANPQRHTFFPITHRAVYEFYKKAMASFWTVEEVDLSADLRDYRVLTADEKHFIKTVLAFFAASDGIVTENLAARFLDEVQLPEARAFYGFQIAMENVHGEMYSLLIETYIDDGDEKRRLLNGVTHIPAIKRKAEWAQRHIASSASFAERLVAFACVEGIFFSGAFCSIFWLKKRHMMPGLTFSNELISRDEGLHTDFACHLYTDVLHETNRLQTSEVLAVVTEAVEVEKHFVMESLPVALIGMNCVLMGEYIEFVADRLLVSLGLERHYNVSNPFDFMEQISLQGKANFFERRVGEYARANVASSDLLAAGRDSFVFTTEEDF